MKYLLMSILMLSLGCTTPPKQHTYLKYSGYIDGCVDATIAMAIELVPNITSSAQLNPVWYESICMDFYLQTLDGENLKPEGIDKHLDRNEQI